MSYVAPREKPRSKIYTLKYVYVGTEAQGGTPPRGKEVADDAEDPRERPLSGTDVAAEAPGNPPRGKKSPVMLNPRGKYLP